MVSILSIPGCSVKSNEQIVNFLFFARLSPRCLTAVLYLYYNKT